MFTTCYIVVWLNNIYSYIKYIDVYRNSYINNIVYTRLPDIIKCMYIDTLCIRGTGNYMTSLWFIKQAELERERRQR